MSNTITVRLEDDLAAWLEQTAAKSGLSRGPIVREQLRKRERLERTREIIHETRREHPGLQKPVAAQGLFRQMKGIADTGFNVAFANKNDQFHSWALEVAGQLSVPLLTCEAVLAEASFHLRSPEIVVALVREGLVALAFDANEHLHQLEAFARHYADREPDFADLCLIRMSELNPRHQVVTTDRNDFRVYRRNKREIIPLVCPDER